MLGAAILGIVMALGILLTSCGSDDEGATTVRAGARSGGIGTRQAARDRTRPVLPPRRDLTPIFQRAPFRSVVKAEAAAEKPVATISPASKLPEGVPLYLESPAAARSQGPMLGSGGGPPARSETLAADSSSCPLLVAGIVREASGFRILLRHGVTGKTEWVTVGDSAFGYRVELITLRGALVERDGRYYVLPIDLKADERPNLAESPAAKKPITEPPKATVSDRGDARFHGTWSGSFGEGLYRLTVTFRPDYTGSAEGMNMSETFNWKVAGNTVQLRSNRGDQDLVFSFENNDAVLVLSGGKMPMAVRFAKR